MTQANSRSSEQFQIVSRRSLIALLMIVAVLGGTAVSLILSPAGAVRNPSNLLWWFLPIALASVVAIQISLTHRRWGADSPEVKRVMQDEWRQTSMLRASRLALAAVLLAQWPLALLFGIVTSELAQPRPAMVMAASTITLGLGAFISLFLFFDRE